MDSRDAKAVGKRVTGNMRNALLIAIEHHRAGRLVDAEREYRALIVEEPRNADAHNGLGMLLAQAGQLAEAVVVLRSAAASRPSDAALWHNLGQALLQAGDLGQAVEALLKCCALAPDRIDTTRLLAAAYLKRAGSGDARSAVDCLQRASARGETTALQLDLGTALNAAGRSAEALISLDAARRLNPDSAAVHYQTAVAHVALDDARSARKSLNRAIDADPADARVWLALACLDEQAGNLDVAVSLFRKAVKANSRLAPARLGLTRVLRALNRNAEADEQIELLTHNQGDSEPSTESVAALELRLALDPEAAQLHEALSAFTHLPGPAVLPRGAVADLFDRYAEAFDEHLDRLGCRIPEQLVEAVRSVHAIGFSDTFDLGCGTGLCGPLLRPITRNLAGVDLSPAMVAKARERAVYDRLEVGELVEALGGHKAAFDLLVAADVLIYIGDLAPVFGAAMNALRPAGIFALTTEATQNDRFTLSRQTRRYKHSETYLRHLSHIYGFEIIEIQSVNLRIEAGQPVAGFLVVLRVPT